MVATVRDLLVVSAALGVRPGALLSAVQEDARANPKAARDSKQDR